MQASLREQESFSHHEKDRVCFVLRLQSALKNATILSNLGGHFMNTGSFLSRTRWALLPALFFASFSSIHAQQPPKPKPLPTVTEEHAQVIRGFIGAKFPRIPTEIHWKF
jgi:hypothetical protein